MSVPNGGILFAGRTQQQNYWREMQAIIKAMESGSQFSPVNAEWAEAFSKFQTDFMEGTDPLTGKKRHDVLAAESRKVEKQLKKGEFIWEGFVKFRGINDLSEINARN